MDKQLGLGTVNTVKLRFDNIYRISLRVMNTEDRSVILHEFLCNIFTNISYCKVHILLGLGGVGLIRVVSKHRQLFLSRCV